MLRWNRPWFFAGPPEQLPVDESHPVGKGLTNPYGKTKFFIEEIFRDVARADGDWKIILLRYFNPVGSHESGLIGEDPQGPPNNLMPYVAQVLSMSWCIADLMLSFFIVMLSQIGVGPKMKQKLGCFKIMDITFVRLSANNRTPNCCEGCYWKASDPKCFR